MKVINVEINAVPYANCLCDCGNRFRVRWRKFDSKHDRTCGKC